MEIWRHLSPWLYSSPDPFLRPKGRHHTLMSELTPTNVTPSPSRCSPGACTPGLGFAEFIFSESRVGLTHREQNPSSRGKPGTPLCYIVGGKREKHRGGESRAALALSDAHIPVWSLRKRQSRHCYLPMGWPCWREYSPGSALVQVSFASSHSMRS